MTDHPTFIPVLTVMVDYGFADFLWIKDSPDEEGYVNHPLADGMSWDEDYPFSEELWKKFAPWAIAFDNTKGVDHAFDAGCWDWAAFHERGLQLTRELKEEVGDTYRVVYTKPVEDPDYKQDDYREVLADGTVVPFHRDDVNLSN